MTNFIKVLVAVGNICAAIVCILKEYSEYKLKDTVNNESTESTSKSL